MCIMREHAIHVIQNYILLCIYLLDVNMYAQLTIFLICYAIIGILNIYENKFLLNKTIINVKPR